ncbi:hypothetical protein [Saccharothrix sp. HUAS TT1]|uniref:hypothetical protein n=1 Tax=unclassified Saccharothrix TaxID=2593673 RepID=UPI00345B55B2
MALTPTPRTPAPRTIAAWLDEHIPGIDHERAEGAGNDLAACWADGDDTRYESAMDVLRGRLLDTEQHPRDFVDRMAADFGVTLT